MTPFVSSDVRAQTSPSTVSQETLYAIQGAAWPHVYEVDPATGVVLRDTPSDTYDPMYGLACRGAELYTFRGINQSDRDELLTIHRGDIRIELRGATSLDWNFRSPDFDPGTGTLYCVGDQKLYTIDRDSGTASLVATLSTGTDDFITALGISPTRDAFVFGSRVWRVDLDDGECTLLGRLEPTNVPPHVAYVIDVAFDDSGALWGALASPGPKVGVSGLYQLDLGAMTKTRIKPGWAYSGLAFARKAGGRPYCAAKVGSIGCVPAIRISGFPSASAPFGAHVDCDEVRNDIQGQLLVGIRAPARIPFDGGTLCVAPPFRRSPFQDSQGAPPPSDDCSGTWNLDLNQFLAQHMPVDAGTSVYVQWFGYEPSSSGPTSVSSDALAIEIQP